MQLNKVGVRDSLRRQREPHWQPLAVGEYLGYRRAARGDGGTWIARYYDSDTRSYRHSSLGDYGHLPANQRFAAARKDAEAWFSLVARGGATKPITVREACERYSADKPEAARRFRQYVYDDPIASVPLQKLTRGQVTGWRKRLEELPALVTRRKRGKPITRKRSASTLNRDMTPFRAALNAAKADGYVATDIAWSAALKPVKNADTRRNIYLTKEQRRELIRHLPPDAATFVEALCMLPIRPGALAGVSVGDFDYRRRELVVPSDKAGSRRKIWLPESTAARFKALARNKLPGAPLFTRADGKPWNKDAWKAPVKEAVHAAGLDPSVTTYTLRHSTITDLVSTGVNLADVAALAGTSIRMIQLHYHHLQMTNSAEALERLAL